MPIENAYDNTKHVRNTGPRILPFNTNCIRNEPKG